jgi:hypothetical protein
MGLFNFIEFYVLSDSGIQNQSCFVKERVTSITCKILVLGSSRMNKKLVLYVLEPLMIHE